MSKGGEFIKSRTQKTEVKFGLESLPIGYVNQIGCYWKIPYALFYLSFKSQPLNHSQLLGIDF